LHYIRSFIDSIPKNTLNAKIETIGEKPSFKYSLDKRCLILADGFYEWHWLDPKGTKKQKYLLTLPNCEPFAFAGLRRKWRAKKPVVIEFFLLFS
jgi:putative SOS response-associated peptidase YedK